MIDQTLFHYRITAAIGAGRMGEVYRATDTKLGREVAIKTMGAPAFVSAWLAYAYGASGDRVRAEAEVEDLKTLSPRGSVTSFNLALVALGQGDHARAVSYLEQAYASDTRSGWGGSGVTTSSTRSAPTRASPRS
jgi:Flp pilus assembly protein TadD